MRKFVVPALSLALCLGLVTGCSSKTSAPAETSASAEETTSETSAEDSSEAESTEPQSVDSLKIAFSPYSDADTITTATEPLENLLKEELLTKGYDVADIDMTVGTSYTAVGEALSAGSADIGFISGGNYVLFSDDCDVLLTALRYAINKDSEDPKDWNDGTIEENTDQMSTYYRSIILAGPSEKGQELLAKVNNGEELTWDDLNSATWAVMGPTSASGYIYPSLWLQERYGKTLADLDNAVQSDSYTTSLARLASGQADVMVSFGHIRTKNAADWQEKLGGTDEMVKQTGIIGVTEPIYNDMIAYSKNSQQQEKSTRVKARVKAHAMRELMETKDRILIMGHKLSDSDAFGSAIGIYRIATALNKKAHVIINEVTTSVQPMMNRFLDNPDYPEDLFLTGAQAAELVDASTMLVVVDVNRPSITDAPELLKLVKTIVVMDHHRQSSEVISNAVLSYVEPYASSACEMVAEVLQYIADGIKIKAAEADAMYAGIVIDTNNFTNQTGVRTFEAAAFLRRNGADVTRVRKLFRDDMQDYKARAAAISSAEIYREAFSIGVCPSEGLPSPTIVCAQAANELLEIKGIKASVVMTEYHGLIYLSARSIDEVNVQVMMEKLGGGGHRTIAGAQLSGISMEEAKDRVKAVIDEMLQKGDIS